MTLASAAFGFGQPLRPNLMFLVGVLALGRVLWWIRTLHIQIRSLGTPPETWRSSRQSHQSRQVDISRACLSRSGRGCGPSRPRARPMRQQGDLGELHGTRERRPGAAHTRARKTLFRPWEPLNDCRSGGGWGMQRVRLTAHGSTHTTGWCGVDHACDCACGPSCPASFFGYISQCSTFTGMRDLRQSNNLHKRIKSGILDHLNTNTTLGHLIKLIVLETTISRIS